jgi:hypothetical protein
MPQNAEPSSAEFWKNLKEYPEKRTSRVGLERKSVQREARLRVEVWHRRGFEAQRIYPKKFIESGEEKLRPKLFRDGRWWADYRRLRLVAYK